jgi:hypothetical protein
MTFAIAFPLFSVASCDDAREVLKQVKIPALSAGIDGYFNSRQNPRCYPYQGEVIVIVYSVVPDAGGTT